MSQERLEKYLVHQQAESAKFYRQITNRFLFRLFLLAKLPMAFLARVRVKSLNEEVCEISVPYRWLNQNPFRSTYFAVLAMAAEMSTGMMAMYYTRNSRPRISMLVSNMEASFVKKATGVTTFRCEDGAAVRDAVRQAVLTGEGKTVRCKTTGYSKNGEVEAEFFITWSFKVKEM